MGKWGHTGLTVIDPNDSMAYAGHMMLSFAAWVAHQERELGRQRTKERLSKARDQGEATGEASGAERASDGEGEADGGDGDVDQVRRRRDEGQQGRSPAGAEGVGRAQLGPPSSGNGLALCLGKGNTTRIYRRFFVVALRTRWMAPVTLIRNFIMLWLTP